jgi:hypothetical protein
MKRSEIEDQVRQTPWPAPSPQLRDRVLSTGVVAAPTITWSDRIWFSRAWRLSALAIALGLVVLDQMSGSPRSAGVTLVTQAPAVLSAEMLLNEFMGEGGG